jgi:hypothetical protein
MMLAKNKPKTTPTTRRIASQSALSGCNYATLAAGTSTLEPGPPFTEAF